MALIYNPKKHQITTLDGRYYTERPFDEEDAGVSLPSVTTVLGEGSPTPKHLIDWIKSMGKYADEVLKEAGKKGTWVHDTVEKLILGEKVDWAEDRVSLEWWGMVRRFIEFYKENSEHIESICTEQTILSKEESVAGTLDWVLKFLGHGSYIDFKTSNGMHFSYEMQAYIYAKMWNHEVKERPFRVQDTFAPFITKGYILWLNAKTRSKRYEIIDGKKVCVQGKGWKLVTVDYTNPRLAEGWKLSFETYKFYNDGEVTPRHKRVESVLQL